MRVVLAGGALEDIRHNSLQWGASVISDETISRANIFSLKIIHQQTTQKNLVVIITGLL